MTLREMYFSIGDMIKNKPEILDYPVKLEYPDPTNGSSELTNLEWFEYDEEDFILSYFNFNSSLKSK